MRRPYGSSATSRVEVDQNHLQAPPSRAPEKVLKIEVPVVKSRAVEITQFLGGFTDELPSLGPGKLGIEKSFLEISGPRHESRDDLHPFPSPPLESRRQPRGFPRRALPPLGPCG